MQSVDSVSDAGDSRPPASVRTGNGICDSAAYDDGPKRLAGTQSLPGGGSNSMAFFKRQEIDGVRVPLFRLSESVDLKARRAHPKNSVGCGRRNGGARDSVGEGKKNICRLPATCRHDTPGDACGGCDHA